MYRTDVLFIAEISVRQVATILAFEKRKTAELERGNLFGRKEVGKDDPAFL